MGRAFPAGPCCPRAAGDFMGETYCVKKSRLVTLRQKYYKKYLLQRFLGFLIGVLRIGLVVAGSGLVTWQIYKGCVEPVPQGGGAYSIPIISCITTGSLFATFGSAVIAVFTLYTGRYLNSFQENLSILMENVEKTTGGMAPRRWPFIPRVSRTRFSNETRFFGIESVHIEFRIDDFHRTFPLPTTEADFRDLPILFNYLNMKGLRKGYLSKLKSPDQLSEYPVWDCVMAIYRGILLYKASSFCVWIGVCFVLQSIAFTFLYPHLYHVF